MANKISVIIDVAVDQANRGLKSFRQSITDADGAAGKFKAGASSAMASVQANAGALAMAGGAALVAFGAKAVSAFQETALAAGQMSDTLGVTAEEASRLIEVADDLGIGADSLEKSINIMNKTAANTPQHFEAIGAQLVKNADGTMNVNETFLSTIDALNKIPDASARAAAAQKVFGRGWTDMAELIGVGAEGVREALASVEGGKIIDDKEVQRARRYRDSMDELRGVIEELTIEIGGAIVPALADIALGIKVVADAAADLEDLTGIDLFGGPREFLKFGPAWDEGPGAILKEITDFEGKKAAAVIEESVMSVFRLADATGEATEELDDYRFSHENVGRAIDATKRKIDALRGSLSDRSAYLAAQEGLAALASQATTTGDVTESQIIDMKNQLLDYSDALDDTASKERVAEMVTELDAQSFWATAIALEQLEKERTVRYNVAIGTARGTTSSGRIGGVPVYAGGTDFHPGGLAVVGDGGEAEIVNLPRGSTVTPLSQISRGSGGGMSINLTVNAGLGVNGAQVGRQIVDVLEAHYRNGGRPPRSA